MTTNSDFFITSVEYIDWNSICKQPTSLNENRECTVGGSKNENQQETNFYAAKTVQIEYEDEYGLGSFLYQNSWFSVKKFLKQIQQKWEV